MAIINIIKNNNKSIFSYTIYLNLLILFIFFTYNILANKCNMIILMYLELFLAILMKYYLVPVVRNIS